MKLLAIDTTGAYSSVALYDSGKIRQIINEDNFSHLQKLIPVINQIMAEESVKAEELDAIAVSQGPGSFTGIRIGMATAKGLAQIWDKKIICVPTLAGFAFRQYDWADKGKTLFCPVFDAKRHQIYGGAYFYEDNTPFIPDGAYDLDDYLNLLREKKALFKKAIFFGDGTGVYEEGLKTCGFEYEFAPENSRFQTAEGCARLGLKLAQEGLFSDCFTASPEYLRAAEAERKLAEKIKADARKFGTVK